MVCPKILEYIKYFFISARILKLLSSFLTLHYGENRKLYYKFFAFINIQFIKKRLEVYPIAVIYLRDCHCTPFLR